jgi:hypothetical protein
MQGLTSLLTHAPPMGFRRERRDGRWSAEPLPPSVIGPASHREPMPDATLRRVARYQTRTARALLRAVGALSNEVQSGQGLTGPGHPGHKANGLVLLCCGFINDLVDALGRLAEVNCASVRPSDLINTVTCGLCDCGTTC